MTKNTKRFALAGIAALLATGSAELPIKQLGGATLAAAAVKQAQSVADLLAQRSPGHRKQGILVQLKHKAHKTHVIAKPRKRVIKHHVPPAPVIAAPEFTPALVDIITAPLTVDVPPLELPDIALIQTPSGPPAFFLPPPGGGFIVPPGGGGGGTPTPPVVTPPVTPPVVPPPAVPEPATWAMMLIGFGAMGLAMRRRRRLALA